MARTFPSAPTESRSSQWTLTSHDWHVQPFVKDQLAFRLSGAPSVRPDSTEGIRPSSKPFKAIRSRKRCQPAEITGFPPDFNSSGSFNPGCCTSLKPCAIAGWRTLCSAFENALPRGMAKKSAHAETEDDSKMKDRLEVLLCAETLQGTLSPNANPG